MNFEENCFEILVEALGIPLKHLKMSARKQTLAVVRFHWAADVAVLALPLTVAAF